jgi:hypothetical protein
MLRALVPVQLAIQAAGPPTMAAMGMFDSYEPSDQFTCAACGRPITHWQGKDGPNSLFVWRQGVAEPVDQPIAPESRMSPERRSRFRLPPTFDLSGWCEQRHRTDAIGRCHGDVWSETEIILSGIE